MKVGERVHGDRFEVVAVPWKAFSSIDLVERATGRGALMASPGWFLEDASSFAMASWVKAAGRSDLAEVLALQPTVLARGTDEGKPTPRELGELTITLLERAFELGAEGISSEPHRAWITRRGERWDLVLPAGLGCGGALHFDERFTAKRWPASYQLLHACLAWLQQRVRPTTPRPGPPPRSMFPDVKTVPEAIQAMAGVLRTPELSAHEWRERRLTSHRIDFALAETLGEAALRDAPEGYRARYVTWPLAALVHRRACLALQAGDARLALATVERAIALDPCARHHTTRALLLERLGEDDAARAAHEAAIAALPDRDRSAGIAILDEDDSVHDARTAHARGAFLARRGDPSAARPWLERALEVPDVLGPDPNRAMRLAALAVVLLRLGDHAGAARRASEALALDPREPSALAVRARA